MISRTSHIWLLISCFASLPEGVGEVGEEQGDYTPGGENAHLVFACLGTSILTYLLVISSK